MRVKQLLLLCLLAAAGLLILAACASNTPTIAPTTGPTQAPLATDTPPATATPPATLTFTPAPTQPTATASPTAAPTVDSALSQVKLIGLAWLEHYNMLLTFEFPGPVDPKQYRVTLEEKEYTCEKLAKYPNRLYCHGAGAKVLTTAWVRVYQAGSELPGFEKEWWIPYFK